MRIFFYLFRDAPFAVWLRTGLAGCLLLFLDCCEPAAPAVLPEDTPFIKEKNAQHNGDYFATYPLSNPDSCLIRIKAEVPASLQPWACLAIWYRLPRSSPAQCFHWLDLYEQHYPHDTVFAFVQMMRGEFLVELRKHDTARVVLADARSRYLRLDRPLDASDADYLVAHCYTQESNFATALESYFKVLDLLNRHDTTFSHRHFSIYYDIATAYTNSRDFQKELYWLNKIWNSDWSRMDESWKYKAQTALRMSANFAKTSSDSSVVMAKLAAEIFRQNSKKPLPKEFLFHLGFAYCKKEDWATALPFFLDAARQISVSASPNMTKQVEQGLGECYFNLGRLDSAEVFIRKALASPDTSNLAAAHIRLADIHARRGDYKTAYEEGKKGNLLFKHVITIEKSAAIAEFETRYKTAQKERLIAELEAKQKIAQQEKLILGLLGLMFTLFLAGLYLRQRGQRHILKQQNEALEKDKTLVEKEKQLAQTLAQLKSQELQRSEADLKITQSELSATQRILVLKNELIEELKLRILEQGVAPEDSDRPPSSSDRSSLRQMKILTDADWRRFRQRFEEHFPGFLPKLKDAFPELTAAETRLFLLIKLKFSFQEMSETLGISLESVYTSRARLGRKFGLSLTKDLDSFVHQFGLG